jgi:F-type H+-transporting ATPase subunit delta
LAARDSVLSHIARPYATALFDLAVETGAIDEFESGLGELAALIEQSEDLRRFLRSPVIAADDKQQALAVLIERGVATGLVANFLQLVARNRRLFALGAMIAEFRQMAAEARNEVRAEVVAASELSEKHRSALEAELKRKLGKHVALDVRIDPSLIGGLIVKVGSRMIDSSLKTKLTAMRFAMREVG